MDLRIISSHLSLDYLNKYKNGKTFIESGTYYGDTIWIALETDFEQIHSIELDKGFYDRAVKLFDHKPQVKIWHGDSVDRLPDILKTVEGPSTLWLDAHASGSVPGGKTGGSPILDELAIIGNHPNKEHTIFIDDRRLFGSAEWSGVLEEQALSLLRKINPKYEILFLDGHIEKDIICAFVQKENVKE
jgi:hypothetical protein